MTTWASVSLIKTLTQPLSLPQFALVILKKKLSEGRSRCLHDPLHERSKD